MFNSCWMAFQASTLRQKLNQGEYSNAADALLRWIKAKGGMKLQGLVRRRTLERSLFLSEIATAAVIISSA
ncbi:glycoside hydrolase family protein [Rickettsia bellii]|uniref:glycoside hydrolase family protein n=1 Tax=Rickettsia bellii TaxID=33990 RepID=UPI0022AC8F0F|nr:glycoside hydrolase family protein [Rickettsia bellii]